MKTYQRLLEQSEGEKSAAMAVLNRADIDRYDRQAGTKYGTLYYEAVPMLWALMHLSMLQNHIRTAEYYSLQHANSGID